MATPVLRQQGANQVTETSDIIVVGGGMVGAAIAYGLARQGAEVAVLDEGDSAFRAARGNFGLVWVQTKGLGMQRYAEWTRQSADIYPDFADELLEATGIDIAHERPGGIAFCLGDAELEERRETIARMARQAGPAGYDCYVLDRRSVQRMLPDVRLGDDVSGGSWCPHDGHVSPLHLLRALHTGMQKRGARYFAERRVDSISHRSGTFEVATGNGTFAAPRLVLAAGHGNPRLGPMVGLDVPTRPQRGQVLVTERLRRILPMPLHNIRQTREGSIMIGNSAEDVGFDDATTVDVGRTMAARAIRVLPMLADKALVRTWGALRVLPPDGFPIYDESESCPGAFVATMHSGVTLAAAHACVLSRWIGLGEQPEGFGAFSARRFAETREHVPATV